MRVTATETDVMRSRYANRIMWISTIGFTVMFAAWMMFGILGVKIQEELGISQEQFSWIAAVAILNGSLWRLPAGMITDHIGGRKVMTYLLASSAIPAYFVARAESYTMLLILAFLVGFAGNSFSSGIAWNSAWQPREHQGFALGVFGAGNVGASVTKLIGPAIITATTGSLYFGAIEGGWRLIPILYAVLLVIMAIVTWFGTPSQDRMPGHGTPLAVQLEPLRTIRVWRFSLYYVAVFGAYVALSSMLPTYYVRNFGVSLTTAGFLTAAYIFPASLLRPLGGWMSDRWGARRVMYGSFGAMLLTSGILMMPNGHIVIEHADGTTTEHLRYVLGVVPFTIVLILLGSAMGIGKAGVYKHIPEYFPGRVGPVGGLVGMFGGLGGFALPPLFTYSQRWTGAPTSMFLVMFLLTLVCAIWMHIVVVQLLRAHAPRSLSGKLEDPRLTQALPAH